MSFLPKGIDGLGCETGGWRVAETLNAREYSRVD
jgi:hypothetical protein